MHKILIHVIRQIDSDMFTRDKGKSVHTYQRFRKNKKASIEIGGGD